MRKLMLMSICIPLVLLAGCAPKFNCRFEKPEIEKPVILPAKEIEIENRVNLEKKTVGLYPTTLYAQFDVQQQFNQSVQEAVLKCTSPGGSQSKATINIDETCIYMEVSEHLSVPFVGLAMLSAGYEAEYVANIVVAIEIENNQGEIVDKVGFEITSNLKDKIGVQAERERGYSNVGSKAISQIYRELSENIRYVSN